MFSNYLIMARARMSSGTNRVLDYVGIESVGESEEVVSWQSTVYRRFSATYGARLPYIIYAFVLGILFLIAVFGDMNETEIHKAVKGNSHGSLRGSADTTATNTTDVHSSTSASHASSNTFWFSMLVSFLTWLAFIQVMRCLYRATRNYGSATNTTTTRTFGRAESTQLMMQLMQLGRAGPGGGLSNRMRMALLQRDFTGDDYEMLQTLDDNTQQRRQQGAQQSEIERLPLHCVTAEELAEQQRAPGGPPTCNICLGPYELGDQVRTVPCMHQFHKACIDTWLRDKAICPVCKYRATV